MKKPDVVKRVSDDAGLTQGDANRALKSFFGKKGIVFRIRDEGEGFDYKEKIRLMEQGRVYYKNDGGSGLKLQNMLPHIYSYEGDGSIINICVLDDNRTKNF